MALDFQGFTPRDIVFDGFEVSEEALAAFVSDYLYAADGNATERLRATLADARRGGSSSVSSPSINEYVR